MTEQEIKGNCFYCDGNDRYCYSYFATMGIECVYKRIANRDMAKHENGRHDTTLTDMLKQYLENESMKSGTSR